MQQALDSAIRQQLGFSMSEAEASSEILINAFDQQHRIVFWNKKAAAYFNISQAEAIGKKLEEIIGYVKQSDKRKHLLRALSGIPVHIANDTYDKRNQHYEQWVLPVKKNGKVVAALNIVKDL